MQPGTTTGAKAADFQQVLNRSIEQGLRNILGESGTQMVLSVHPLDSISTDFERFHKAMRAIFKDTGAIIIEREIARILLENVGNERNRQGWWLRMWPLTSSSTGTTVGRASEKEKRLLRRFLALESIPGGHSADPERLGEYGEGPIELTAINFAYAFKKGS